MWRRKELLYLLLIYLVASKIVAETDEPPTTQCGGSCRCSYGDYESLKKLVEVEVKQNQLEKLITAQRNIIDSQQNTLTKLQEKVTGLDRKTDDTYPYKDIVAQASCTALYGNGNYLYAIRRQCSAQASSCDELCKSLGKTCFNAIHVYDGVQLDPGATGLVGLGTFKYNSCSGNFCGPNFCCCAGK